MVESTESLVRRMNAAMESGFRKRLLDRGLARGMLWNSGQLPAGAPIFSPDLTEDLLDYSYALFAMALQLRSRTQAAEVLSSGFLTAGEGIEAAVHRGERAIASGFHRVSAAVAFHLARYSARAYSILPSDITNLSPTEGILVALVRRRLTEMGDAIAAWLSMPQYSDESIAQQLLNSEEFDEADAVHLVLTNSFMRGLALFDHAITTGESDSANEARRVLLDTADAALDLNAPNHWWTATLASHLVDELWQLSLHQRIPLLPDGDPHADAWLRLRKSYIHRLRSGQRAAIELWPSQLSAASRAIDPQDDLIVALPTSAGKTRIAELCILRALAAEQRVIYVTPLRALSAQVERDLTDTFTPLGFDVSSLYGSAVSAADGTTLSEGRIVVATPEKIDFALRNDQTIIDDVGLIVLDEGHMLGPNEREVRYEALVQRLVRRPDGGSRRIVCLSALFPTPAEMADLVGWLRQDAPGDAVHSAWRPTRQRFGVIQWKAGAARLDVAVEKEAAFVPAFVQASEPPSGSRRKNLFPANKNELTLAAAWQFVEQGKDVLVYSPLRASIETIGRLVLKCIEGGLLKPLRKTTDNHRAAMAVGAEWLGAHHPAVRCLQHGIALHHGGLPRPFLNEVERILRVGECPITIASPTLAQGLNLSASVLIVPSIWRNKKEIPDAEFANVAGRAGRAFVDLEGLVVNIVWEATPAKTRRAIGKWTGLVKRAKAPRVASGILQLTLSIYNTIALSTGVALHDVVDYVTGHAEAWDFDAAGAARHDVKEDQWDRDLASLDAAVLALIDADTPAADIPLTIEAVLQGSLFSRELARKNDTHRRLVLGFVAARANRIWSQTVPAQRKGYHAAGVGLVAGKFLDANIEILVQHLIDAEGGLAGKNPDRTIWAVLAFAELVLSIAPFRPPDALPGAWRDALRSWMQGKPSVDVIALCGSDGVDVLQEAFAYRLPWAMEAVRVHGIAVGVAGAVDLSGATSVAVEAGSTNASVIELICAGLGSREAAAAAVSSTGAVFEDRASMKEWLASPDIQARTNIVDWPTAASHGAWLRFQDEAERSDRRLWTYSSEILRIDWFDAPPPIGTSVVVGPDPGRETSLVLSRTREAIGRSKTGMKREVSHVISARTSDLTSIVVECFGPPPKKERATTDR